MPRLPIDFKVHASTRKYHANQVYRPETDPEIAFRVLASGLGYASVAAEIGVAKKTIWLWTKTFPEFLQAVLVGLAAGEDAWDRENAEHSVIVTDKDGPKITYNDRNYRYIKSCVYGQHEKTEMAKFLEETSGAELTPEQTAVLSIVKRLQARSDEV